MNRKDTFARRVVPALTLIGASGAILAALDRPSDGLDAAVGPPLSTATNESTVTVIPTIAPSSGAATTQTTVVGDQNSTQDTNPPTPTPTVAPVVESTVPPAPAPVACGGMILGPTIDTKFGPVQVQASVDSTGYVCSAQGVVWPTRDRESVDINNQAVPLLDQWAAYQHDASFNSISGATYTSKAYKQSLQAIIDGARA